MKSTNPFAKKGNHFYLENKFLKEGDKFRKADHFIYTFKATKLLGTLNSTLMASYMKMTILHHYHFIYMNEFLCATRRIH